MEAYEDLDKIGQLTYNVWRASDWLLIQECITKIGPGTMQ